MKKVLIVGGAGYVGSHQVKMMCDLNYNVIVVDNLNTGHQDAIDERAKFYEGDIRDYEFIKSVLSTEKPDGVMHFAALSLVGESSQKPLDYYNNNVYGMEVLLRAMGDCDVKNIIFSSSAATYGKHDVMPITEEYATNPENPYGETKLAMEKMMKWVEPANGTKFVALRYFNVAGAAFDSSIGERHNPETHLIPLVLEVALDQREYISVFGTDYNTPDGTCIRDYIHVVDLCDAHVLAFEHLLNGGESKTYNLGYGNGYSVKEIIQTARKVTGHPIPQKEEPRRIGDPDQLVAASDKLVAELKWEPKYNDIEKIIASAYEFHKKDLLRNK